jgi:hypothetical protein
MIKSKVHQIPDNLQEILSTFPGNGGGDVQKQIEAAMKKIQDADFMSDFEKIEEEDVREKIIKNLGEIQDQMKQQNSFDTIQ